MIRKLPAGFVLGAAVAGRGESVKREDIERCQDFHIKALNISLAWTQIIQDEEGTVSEAGIRHYRAIFETCLAHGIEPYVALDDFDMASAFFARDDAFASPQSMEQFLHYAKVCFQAFGDMVKIWITMKDPVSFIIGTYAGKNRLSERQAVAPMVHALHKMFVVHSRTVMLYKSMNLGGAIGIVHRAEAVYPLAGSPANEKAAFWDDALANRFLLDAVLGGSYSAKTLAAIHEILQRDTDSFAPADGEMACLREAAGRMDFFGVNYYASHFCERLSGKNRALHKAAGGKMGSYALPGISRCLRYADRDWSIFPHGLYDMLLRIHEEYPQKPIYVMENGLGLRESLPPVFTGAERMVEDDNRIDYICQHLDAVLAAREEGVDVRGYFVWSLLDSRPRPDDCEKRYGLFFVDFRDQKRYPKKSACWYRDLAQHRLMLTLEPSADRMINC